MNTVRLLWLAVCVTWMQSVRYAPEESLWSMQHRKEAVQCLQYLETDAKVIEEAIRRRYHGSSWKALIVAYRDALKHYQRAMAAEAEEKGKKGDN